MPSLQALSQIEPVSSLRADGVPTASIALLFDGNIETHIITNGSENSETVYQACSISKPIAGLAVAKLVHQGRLSYTTPITDHLPAHVLDLFTDAKTRPLLDKVTVGQLVSHTSGLSQHGFPGYAGEVVAPEQVLSGAPPANTPKVRFNSFPGAQFSYSGGGWTVLQLFLEFLLSKPFPEIMQDLVLGPLEMTRSHYGPLAPSEQNFAPAHATAELQAQAPYHEFAELAAAGLWTTPSDLLKAVAAVQNSLTSSTSFLSSATAEQFLTPVLHAGASKGHVAMGFFTTPSAFGHAGSNDPGYRSYLLGSLPGSSLPAGVGVAIMTNSQGGWEAIAKLMPAIFRLQGWKHQEGLPCYAGSSEEYVPFALPGAVDANWEAWVGEWEGGWRIEALEEKPVLRFGGMEVGLVSGAGPRVCNGEGEEYVLVADGLDIAVRLTRDGDGQRFVRFYQPPSGVKTLRRVGN